MKKLLLAALVLFSVTAYSQVGAGLQMKSAKQKGSDPGLPVKQIPQDLMRMTFAKVISNDWDTDFWTDVKLGTGMAISQASGNGIITTGTTSNSETILRSVRSFTGSFNLRTQVVLSQRIAQNNFFVELVDLIGDGLAITISSATAVTVSFPSGHGFTSQNIGQSMYLGGYTGTGTFIPGRYAIASVSTNDITFTVAGFSAGSGTCSAFGWNYHQVLYSGTTATSATYDAQRRGWASGATTITVNTTANPGHLLHMGSDDGFAYAADQLVASAANMNITQRASRVVNIADEERPLFIQIRTANGTAAPASTTTLTIGSVSMESYTPSAVSLMGNKAIARQLAQPVIIDGTPAVSATISGTPSVNATPVTYATNGTTTASLNSAATTNATSLKASAGIIYAITANNTTAAAKYIRIFNKASAPTMGTDVPIMVITVPASQSKEIWFPVGLRLTTGIAYAITNAATATDNTAVAAGDVQLLINYQ